MTVTVAEEDGVHRALVPGADTVLRCCREGHESAGEAARHARAIARVMAREAPDCRSVTLGFSH